MKAVLRCDLKEGGDSWDTSFLKRKVVGVPLLKRHLLALKEAGLKNVRVHALPNDPNVAAAMSQCRNLGVETELVEAAPSAAPTDGAVLEQRADTLVDPRLIPQLLSISRNGGRSAPRSFVCVDRYEENHPHEAKSPYRVGVPHGKEASLIEHDATEARHPIGLSIKTANESAGVDVGRFYWHRIREAKDLKQATWKALLATMKPTDGIYARTNRRVSLRISRALAWTPVTPNMVSVFTLACSLFSGFLFAQGSYLYMVAGAFMSWCASMLDGVDGELARAKFQTSDFGCWLEMVCDYLYYVIVFTGMGLGLYRNTDNVLWLYLGIGSALGSLLAFGVVAHQRKIYSSQGDAGDYGRAFQEKVGRQAKTNPIYAFTRKTTFFATRAALPYYIFVFTVLGWVKGLMVISFVGVILAGSLAGYVTRLFTSTARD